MPILSREEREAANKASAEKNLKLRETRSNARREKNEIRERLQGVNNTSDRRSIKSGAIYDLSTNSYVEKKEFPQTGKRSIQDNAIDFVDRDRIEEEGGGGGGLAGIEIIWADQSISFIEAADLTDTYNNEAYWSLVLTVSSGSFDKILAYDATPDIFTTTGTAPDEVQTKYRLRLITQYANADGDNVSTGISAYGQYREVTTCINGYPRQRLTKVT